MKLENYDNQHQNNCDTQNPRWPSINPLPSDHTVCTAFSTEQHCLGNK